MSKTFKRLASEARRKGNTRRVLNWAARLHHLEVAVFELNARLVSQLQRIPEGELTEADKAFFVAAEEFRAHVKEVLEANHGATS